MSITDLLAQLRKTFAAGETAGSFDATQILAGEFVPLFTRLGLPTTIALTSAAGWQSDGTVLTLSGASGTTLASIDKPAVTLQFLPKGADWIFLLDITLPADWTFGKSFPLLKGGILDDLVLGTSPAALIVASDTTVDAKRPIPAGLTIAGPGPMPVIGPASTPVVAGFNFYGTFATNSSALTQVLWIFSRGEVTLTTGPIDFDAQAGTVVMNLPLADGELGALFGSGGPHVTLAVTLYSGLNSALHQYESGLHLDTTLTFDGKGMELWSLLSYSAQPVLDLNLTGSALSFPSAATLGTFFGSGNSIAGALPDKFRSATSLLTIDGITFGVGLQSKQLEYAFVSVATTAGETWDIVPNVLQVERVSFLFSIFQPLSAAPMEAFSFTALFQLGGGADGLPVILQGQLPGAVLSGGLDPTVSPPALKPLLLKLFGSSCGLPDDLQISKLTFQADIGSGQYSADLEIAGSWSFDFGHENEVTFEDLVLSVNYGPGWSGTLAARFVIDDDNQFTVEFDVSPTNTTFIGNWVFTGVPLTFQDLAVTLGMYGIPDIPGDLEVGLSAASFTFESGAPSFVFELETVMYTGDDPAQGTTASAALVAGKHGDAWGFLFGMVVGLNLKLDLTKIPVVGNLVPAGDDILALTDMRLLAGTTVLPAYTPSDDLTTIFGTAVNSGLVLMVDAQLGSALTKTLSVRFGGSDDGTASDLPPATPAPTAALASPPASLGGPPAALPAGAAATAQPGQQVSWVDVQRSFGPVQINRVGFTITPDSEVGLLLDAGVDLGGLSLGLTGLEATLALQWPLSAPHFDLAGLDVQYAASSFSIGGGLSKAPGVSPAKYTGELILAMGSFGATAFGSYTTDGGVPSLFAFLFIDGPVGGPPAFFVTGLAGGFGYNRSLQLPTIDAVADYPLVKGAMGTLNAADTQSKLDGFIQPQQNETWFAAGVRFTSFEMVKSFALLTVAFGTNTEIALLGESTLTVPVSTADKPQSPVAEADLVLLVDVQVSNGVVAANAQLSPSSYVFSHAAQLTGGFAFYTWFGPSPYRGDFVLTLGGYNRYFQPPSYYPQVPRLGLNWKISDEMSIKGGLYFALTPSVLMAGGSLSATWQSGDISAWYDVAADFLIRFKPFTYLIHASISIGVSAKIDLSLTSFTLTVHVGVDLTLWGPEFGGTAYIDLSVISFTIGFGSDGPPDDKHIGWPEFRNSFLPPVQIGSGGSAGAKALAVNGTPAQTLQDAAVTPTNSLITIAAPTGIVSTSSTSGATLWTVSPGKLKLVVATLVPSTVAVITPAPAVPLASGWNLQLGVGPMGASAGTLVSTLTIEIDYEGGVDTGDRWQATALLDAVPAGMWLNTGNSMQTDGTVPNVLVGVSLEPAPPAGAATLPVSLARLMADKTPICPFRWSVEAVPRTDTFDQTTSMAALQNKLIDTGVGSTRGNILAALRKQGVAVAGQCDVSRFAARAPDLLFAAPALRSLGEARTQ